MNSNQIIMFQKDLITLPAASIISIILVNWTTDKHSTLTLAAKILLLRNLTHGEGLVQGLQEEIN